MKFLRLHHSLELRIHRIDELTLDFVDRSDDLRRRQAVGILDDRKRIAGKALRGEYIDGGEAQSHAVLPIWWKRKSSSSKVRRRNRELQPFKKRKR